MIRGEVVKNQVLYKALFISALMLMLPLLSNSSDWSVGDEENHVTLVEKIELKNGKELNNCTFSHEKSSDSIGIRSLHEPKDQAFAQRGKIRGNIRSRIVENVRYRKSTSSSQDITS